MISKSNQVYKFLKIDIFYDHDFYDKNTPNAQKYTKITNVILNSHIQLNYSLKITSTKNKVNKKYFFSFGNYHL